MIGKRIFFAFTSHLATLDALDSIFADTLRLA